MAKSPFRENAKLRIDLDSTEGYPLLIGRPLGEVINSTRAAHQRFRFAQRWLPNPNGWAALGLALMTAFTALLYLIPTAEGSGSRIWLATEAIIFGLGSLPCLFKRSNASGANIALIMYLLISSILLPCYAGGQDFQGMPHTYFPLIVSMNLTLVSFAAIAQLLSALLERNNGGYWRKHAWKTYSVQEWVNETIRGLSPIKARLLRISMRITWLQADIVKTNARLQAYANADASDLSAAQEVDKERLERFSEELAEISPLHDTAQKHEASLISLLETLVNVANEHRPTPDLYGTYEGEEREKVLHTSIIGEYRKYLAVVERAEIAKQRITTSCSAKTVANDDRDEDATLPAPQKATA